jgi:hypothetical protein
MKIQFDEVGIFMSRGAMSCLRLLMGVILFNEGAILCLIYYKFIISFVKLKYVR